MTDTVEILTAAFRKIGVTATGTPLTAEETAEGLDELNRMMHGFALRSVDMEHTDLTAVDAFPLASKFEEGIVYLLADRLSHDYMMPAAFDADDWFRTFQASYAQAFAFAEDTVMTNLPSRRRC